MRNHFSRSLEEQRSSKISGRFDNLQDVAVLDLTSTGPNFIYVHCRFESNDSLRFSENMTEIWRFSRVYRLLSRFCSSWHDFIYVFDFLNPVAAVDFIKISSVWNFYDFSKKIDILCIFSIISWGHVNKRRSINIAM